MDITPKVEVGRLTIESYGSGGFAVPGERREGSAILFEKSWQPWAITRVEDIDVASLAPILEKAAQLDVVLVGTGARGQFLSKAVRDAFEAAGLGVDSMDTGAACRTFNVLAIEQRRVAAALIAVE